MSVIGGLIGFGIAVATSTAVIVHGNDVRNQVQGVNLGVPLVLVGFLPLSITTTCIGAMVV
jgi:hypothetical protein